MSKNPKFEIGSLINKCTTELNTFLTLDASYFLVFSDVEKQTILSELNIWMEKEFGDILKNFTKEKIKIPKEKIDGIIYPTPKDVKTELENIKNNLLSILSNTITSSDSVSNTITSSDLVFKEISTFNYLDYLHDIEQEIEQNKENKIELTIKMCKLWIIRNYLCYLLFCYATFLFENETEFKSIIKTREFKAEIGNKIDLFELGIFGSSNPTSDIDIGIRYMGYDDTIGLSYVISVVEDLFHLFIGVENSLALDIEPYADMYILPNWDEKTKDKYPDMFFLNTSNFTESNFKKVLPYIYASIIRNYIKGDDTQLNSFSRPNLPILNNDNTKFFNKYLDINSNEIYFMNGTDMALNYMKADYNKSREKYYTKVNNAEKLLKDIRVTIHTIQITNNIKQTRLKIQLTKNDVLNCMIKIMESLVYRQESYVCPSTITHVVRTMQVKTGNNAVCSFDTNTQDVVIPTNDAICAIGKYGYIMSALEQYGYLIRFHNFYCSPGKMHFDKNNCSLKYEKYNKRLISAKDGYDQALIRETTKVGGIIKMSRKKSKKRNKTRKNSKKTRKQKYDF